MTTDYAIDVEICCEGRCSGLAVTIADMTERELHNHLGDHFEARRAVTHRLKATPHAFVREERRALSGRDLIYKCAECGTERRYGFISFGHAS